MTDPFVIAAKVLWSQRPGSDVVPWEKLGDLGQDLLVKDAKAVIKAWKDANLLTSEGNI